MIRGRKERTLEVGGRKSAVGFANLRFSFEVKKPHCQVHCASIGLDRPPMRLRRGLTRLHGGLMRLHGGLMRLHGGLMRLHGGLMRLHGGLMRLHRRLMRLHGGLMRLHRRLMRLHRGLMRLHRGLMRLHAAFMRLHAAFMRLHRRLVRFDRALIRPHSTTFRSRPRIGCRWSVVGLQNFSVSAFQHAIVKEFKTRLHSFPSDDRKVRPLFILRLIGFVQLTPRSAPVRNPPCLHQ